jgi:hypothetical protein
MLRGDPAGDTFEGVAEQEKPHCIAAVPAFGDFAGGQPQKYVHEYVPIVLKYVGQRGKRFNGGPCVDVVIDGGMYPVYAVGHKHSRVLRFASGQLKPE